MDRAFEDTQRYIGDALWCFKLGDVATIDKFEVASSRPRREKNPTDPNAGNSVIFPLYVFLAEEPQRQGSDARFRTCGVHGRLTSNYAQNAPGAHRFNRIDTKLAKESRTEWDFLARYLN